MQMFLDTTTGSKQVTAEDLKRIMSDGIEMGPMETLELVEIDDNGDLHFEITAYGIYY